MTGSMMERLEENKFLITQSPNHLITFKNVCCGFHLNNILTILTPLTFTLCDRAETLAMTAFAGGALSKPRAAFHLPCHSELVSESPHQSSRSTNTSQKLVQKSIVLLKPT